MLAVVLAFLAGLGVSEYYNRLRIDRIRREQLEELRSRVRAAEPGSGVLIRAQRRSISSNGGSK